MILNKTSTIKGSLENSKKIVLKFEKSGILEQNRIHLYQYEKLESIIYTRKDIGNNHFPHPVPQTLVSLSAYLP